jgi:hypothetical protein
MLKRSLSSRARKRCRFLCLSCECLYAWLVKQLGSEWWNASTCWLKLWTFSTKQELTPDATLPLCFHFRNTVRTWSRWRIARTARPAGRWCSRLRREQRSTDGPRPRLLFPCYTVRCWSRPDCCALLLRFHDRRIVFVFHDHGSSEPDVTTLEFL